MSEEEEHPPTAAVAHRIRVWAGSASVRRSRGLHLHLSATGGHQHAANQRGDMRRGAAARRFLAGRGGGDGRGDSQVEGGKRSCEHGDGGGTDEVFR